MAKETLARRLGTTTHISPLLMKAKRLGLSVPEDLERLAISRGLRYYSGPGEVATLREDPVLYGIEQSGGFSNEELAIAMLSLAFQYSQQRLRMGAAMLSAEGNSPEKLARLARLERCEIVVHHIATCGQKVEPENRFWINLIDHLPAQSAVKVGLLPHITRFVAMTGFTRRGRETVMEWIRPTMARI